METDENQYNKLDPAVAFIHGACLVFLDGLGSGIVLDHYVVSLDLSKKISWTGVTIKRTAGTETCSR